MIALVNKISRSKPGVISNFSEVLNTAIVVFRPDVRLRQGCDPSHNMQDFEGCAGLAGAEPHA